MNCPKCGAGIPNGAAFCQNCGMPVGQQPAMAPRAPLSPAVRLQKKLGTSPLYLTGIIAYSCAILFTLANAVAGNSGLTGMLYKYMDVLGSDSLEMYMAMRQLENSLDALRGFSLLSALSGSLLLIVIAVGMWMLFASAIDKTGAPMRDTGLSIIRIVAIIQLVCQCLVLGLLEVVMLIIGAMAGSQVDEMWTIVIVAMLLIAVFFVPTILMYAKLVKTLGVMRNTMRSGMASDQVSVYVAVMSIILGVLNLFSIFGGFFAVLTSLCNAVAGITFGIFLFEYKNKMRSLMMGMPVEGINAPESAPVPVYSGAAPMQNVPQNSAPASTPASGMYTPPSPAPIVPPTTLIQETTVLNQNMRQDTTVLNAPPVPTVRLVRVRDGSVITVDRAQFRIGRDPGVADYIVTDNTAVGRQHADIIQHDGACYIVDLESVNHVYVNGAQLQPGVECQLQNGDEILLADEAFRVDIR